MYGSRIGNKTVSFSFENGGVWTGSQARNQVTVFSRLNPAVFIKYFVSRVYPLFGGGVNWRMEQFLKFTIFHSFS